MWEKWGEPGEIDEEAPQPVKPSLFAGYWAGACLLQPHLPHILHRIHQRQLLPALIAVSHMRVEDLGFLVGKFVL